MTPKKTNDSTSPWHNDIYARVTLEKVKVEY